VQLAGKPLRNQSGILLHHVRWLPIPAQEDVVRCRHEYRLTAFLYHFDTLPHTHLELSDELCQGLRSQLPVSSVVKDVIQSAPPRSSRRQRSEKGLRRVDAAAKQLLLGRLPIFSIRPLNSNHILQLLHLYGACSKRNQILGWTRQL
jgi:hypothetical protein